MAYGVPPETYTEKNICFLPCTIFFLCFDLHIRSRHHLPPAFHHLPPAFRHLSIIFRHFRMALHTKRTWEESLSFWVLPLTYFFPPETCVVSLIYLCCLTNYFWGFAIFLWHSAWNVKSFHYLFLARRHSLIVFRLKHAQKVSFIYVIPPWTSVGFVFDKNALAKTREESIHGWHCAIYFWRFAWKMLRSYLLLIKFYFPPLIFHHWLTAFRHLLKTFCPKGG